MKLTTVKLTHAWPSLRRAAARHARSVWGISPEGDEYHHTRPAGWAASLAPDAHALLLSVAQQRAFEMAAFEESQDAKAVRLMGITTAITGLSGIFGELQLSWTVPGILTGAALLGLTLSLVFAMRVLWVRSHETGIDVVWLSHYFGGTRRQREDEVLEAAVKSFARSRNLVHQRGPALRSLSVLVSLQVALVLAIELTAQALA